MIEGLLASAVEVHRVLGPGLLESAYEAALCCELRLRGLDTERQVEVPVLYKGEDAGIGYRADLVVEGQLLVELKCVRAFETTHVRQALTYLRFLGLRRGFLLNFDLDLMKSGIKRLSL